MRGQGALPAILGNKDHTLSLCSTPPPLAQCAQRGNQDGEIRQHDVLWLLALHS